MSYEICKIKKCFDEDICMIIKNVGAEYGAVGEGFGPADSEVLHMSEHYNEETRSRYIVASINNKIVGGCGIASFNNSFEICELRKLFLLPESRGLGLGLDLVKTILTYAKSAGYTKCYLDTLTSMSSAIKLYEKLDFKHLTEPLAGTIHGGCDVWMLKTL